MGRACDRLTPHWSRILPGGTNNLFNYGNLDLPDHFLGSLTFGSVLPARNGRRMQFGLQFSFLREASPIEGAGARRLGRIGACR